MARDKYISVRVDPKVHKELVASAKEQELSLQKLIEEILAREVLFLNPPKKKEGKE